LEHLAKPSALVFNTDGTGILAPAHFPPIAASKPEIRFGFPRYGLTFIKVEQPDTD
jgi:hypothetical protein